MLFSKGPPGFNAFKYSCLEIPALDSNVVPDIKTSPKFSHSRFLSNHL